MKDFFKLTNLDKVFEFSSNAPLMGTEKIKLADSYGRILSRKILADNDLPEFSRSTMDGYAVQASSTFGASEGSPAYLNIKGSVLMAEKPDFSIGPQETAKIATGGMLPENSDSVVMVEHTEAVDESTIETYKSVAPGQNVILKGEDYKKNEVILEKGTILRPQETGLLAAFGHEDVVVYKKPVVGIISTGDEVVSVQEFPPPGCVRDINTYTLSSLVKKNGGIPVSYGIVKDNLDSLFNVCQKAVSESDMILISGGSSVGLRDYTIKALSNIEDSQILVHGIPISPGKPTILAKAGKTFIWGLPGHVVSAMIVFEVVVTRFMDRLKGISFNAKTNICQRAILTRNISSAQGRSDFLRVKLSQREGKYYAEPVLGKSGLINTMVKADGIIEIGIDTEGLFEGTEVSVTLI